MGYQNSPNFTFPPMVGHNYVNKKKPAGIFCYAFTHLDIDSHEDTCYSQSETSVSFFLSSLACYLWPFYARAGHCSDLTLPELACPRRFQRADTCAYRSGHPRHFSSAREGRVQQSQTTGWHGTGACLG